MTMMSSSCYGNVSNRSDTDKRCRQFADDENNSTTGDFPFLTPLTEGMVLVICCYIVICVVGSLGNGLVVYVVLRFSTMRSVTNTYILNLAIADLSFLLGLPFVIVTVLRQMWVFGSVICQFFYILTSINWFTSTFTLAVLSADRYFAVCHPVSSLRYRTRSVANCVCIGVWMTSFLVMMPIFLYGKAVDDSGRTSCTIDWPKGQPIDPNHAFIWYAFCLGFLVPVGLISVFYTLVVVRLRSVGPKNKTQRKIKSHRKVTQLVLTVITVYVVCWLPYWVYQTVMLFFDLPRWTVLLFQLMTILTYCNSALNPLLYAFLSENFRKSFYLAFSCEGPDVVNATLLGGDQASLFRLRKSTVGTLTTAYATSQGTTASKSAARGQPDLEEINEAADDNASAIEMEELLLGETNNSNDVVKMTTDDDGCHDVVSSQGDVMMDH